MNRDDWPLHLAATQDGLCYVGTPGMPYEELEKWVHARMPDAAIERGDAELLPYMEQLSAYFSGESSKLDVPLDLYGTPFQRSVWQALLAIPSGTTCSYSELAESLQRPDAVRAIAAAVGANPALIVVPCHRVIGKNGLLTGYRSGLAMKEALLRLEKKIQLHIVEQ